MTRLQMLRRLIAAPFAFLAAVRAKPEPEHDLDRALAVIRRLPPPPAPHPMTLINCRCVAVPTTTARKEEPDSVLAAHALLEGDVRRTLDGIDSYPWRAE